MTPGNKLIQRQEHDPIAGIESLLQVNATAYTNGQSSSLPLETMVSLSESIYFTIKTALGNDYSDPEQTPAETEFLYEEGQRILAEKLAATKKLYEAACITAPPLHQRSYDDTLKSIGTFFQAYQPELLAQEIPCTIDYQLCRGIPQDKLGVIFIEAYLKAILTENRILSLYPLSRVRSLLQRYCPAYRQLIVNLCEPVLANTIGHLLLETDPRPLKISAEELQAIETILRYHTDDENTALLTQAAETLCTMLNLGDEDCRQYIIGTAQDLRPRAMAALDSGGCANIFMDF